MKDTAKEPLCTVKGLLLFAAIAVVYSSILFSLDSEYVGWAAPLVFGGALYAPDPPPASAHLALPSDVLPLAYLYGSLALFAIMLLNLVQNRRHLDWLSWFKAEIRAWKRRQATKLSEVLTHLYVQPLNSPSPGAIVLHGATTRPRQERFATLRHCSRPFSGHHAP